METNEIKPLYTQVLIVGGGITGLSAALFLLAQGIKLLVIERHKTTSVHPRARGFDIRTMELLRELGLSEKVREAGKALGPSWGIMTNKSLVDALAKKKRRKTTGVKFPSQMKGVESLAAMSPESGARCTQDLSEPVLLQAARERGAEILFHTELLSFSQHEQGITGVIGNRETGEQQLVHAGYMIAADGAKSDISEALHAKSDGPGALGNLLNIYFEAELTAFVRGREFSILRINRPGVKGFLSAINNSNRWAFQLYYDPAKGERYEDFTAEKIVPILQQVIGLPELKIRIISILPWQPTVRVVDNMEYGRIFLAGDAAHTMTPYGGKGANTGIQDVHNLAWKLAAVLQGKAGPGLLQTYHTERRPVGWYYATRSGAMADKYGLLKRPTLKFIWPFLNVMMINKLGVGKLFPRTPLKQLGYLMGLPNYRYVSSAIVSEGKSAGGFVKNNQLRAKPGTRMPHIWLENGDGKKSTLDFLGKQFVLFTCNNVAFWEKIAIVVGEKFGIEIPVYSIGKEGTPIFAATDVEKCLGITDGAVLVRPDGFVAWRSKTGDTQSLKALENAITEILSIPINVPKSKSRYKETAA